MPKPEVDGLVNYSRGQRTSGAHEVGARTARFLRATSRDRERLGGLLRVAVQEWASFQGNPIPPDTDGASSIDTFDLVNDDKFCGIVAGELERLLGSSDPLTGPVPSALHTWQL